MSRPASERKQYFTAYLTGEDSFKDEQVVEVFMRGLYEMVDEREQVLNIIGDFSTKGFGRMVMDAISQLNASNKKLRMSPVLPVEANGEMFDKLDIKMVCLFGKDDFGGYGNIPTYSIARIK